MIREHTLRRSFNDTGQIQQLNTGVFVVDNACEQTEGAKVRVLQHKKRQILKTIGEGNESDCHCTWHACERCKLVCSALRLGLSHRAEQGGFTCR